MKNNIYDINYLWIMFVILHVSGATLFMMFYGIPYLHLILLNLLMLAFVIYTGYTSHVSMLEHLHMKMFTLKQTCFMLIITIGFIIMAEYVNMISLLFSNNYVSSVLENASNNLPATILTYAILPAVVEEIMFRGCILRGTTKKGVALLVSSATFALLHGNFNQMCYAFFMGLCMGIVVLLTDNLSVTIGIHVLFNTYSILVAAFSGHKIVAFIENVRIGSYTVFAPVLEKSQMGNQLITGLGVFVSTGIIVSLVMSLFYPAQLKKILTEDKDVIPNTWKPDIKFGIGCMVCLVLAVLSG